jgi:hypothetical protein
MNKYRIKYSLESAPGCVFVKDLSALSPVRALDIFHGDIQKDRGIKPSGYGVTSLGLIYGADAYHKSDGDVIQSYFDLPKCANPDLKKVESVPAQFTTEAWWLSSPPSQTRIGSGS